MVPVEASSEALRLPPKVGINQVDEIDKVIKSISWEYPTEFILYVRKDPELGTQ